MASFDTISHPALTDRVRRRVADKRVLTLVKAFLHAGVLAETGALRNTHTGTPQGGILSPLLANIALSVLDEHLASRPGGPNTSPDRRRGRLRRGRPNHRLIRYADDLLVLVSGTREHAQDMRAEVAAVLAPMGLRLSMTKTRITHIDQGLDFLGWRVQRHRKRGTDRCTSTPTPQRKPSRRSRRRSRPCAGRTSTSAHGSMSERSTSMCRGWA